jgi:hypothetical protein
MSGTTSLCLTQQWHNATHEPLVGGLLYSFQAGTLNPQNAYRTAALTGGEEFPNPVTLDASGRIPLMFYDDGVVRVLMTDRNGVAQFDYDNVPVIGSSGGGGGVDTTDSTRLLGTGDMKIRYGTGAISGYVRGNARTIGSATSGASELADATAQALFQYFWNTDTTLVVLPSRGASAVADWTANKQITTPDFRGVVIGGLDGMGNVRSGRMTGGWDALQTAIYGFESHTLTTAQIPAHGHSVDVTSVSVGVSGGVTVSSVSVGVSGSYSGSASVTVPDHAHGNQFAYTGPGAFGAAATAGSGFGFVQAGNTATHGSGNFTASGSSSGGFSGSGSGTGSGSFSGGGSGTGSGSAANTGGGLPHNIIQPTRLVTVYFRL